MRYCQMLTEHEMRQKSYSLFVQDAELLSFTANKARYPSLRKAIHDNTVGELSTGGQHRAYLLYRELRFRAALMRIKYTPKISSACLLGTTVSSGVLKPVCCVDTT